MKSIIIDDEALARGIIREYLEAYPSIAIAEECENGFEGLKAIQHHQPGLIFLDIQMPKINGFEMLELLDHPPAVIFTTAFDEYAMKAFEANAIDYLLKPFSQQRFNKAVEKFLSLQQSNARSIDALLDTASLSPAQSERIVVKNGNKIKIIPTREIWYIEAADDFVKIYTKEGYFLKNKTMSHLEKVLDPRYFVRCHRSYIVNIQEITRIVPYEKESQIAILRTGAKVPVSRNGYARMKAALGG